MALPVIVLAFVWVGRFIGWLFACVALPTHLLFLLVNQLGGVYHSIKDSNPFHVLFFPIRLILVLLPPIFWAGLGVGIGLLIHFVDPNASVALKVMMPITYGVVSILGFVVSNKDKYWNCLKSITWNNTERGYWNLLGQALYDLVAFFGFVFVVATVVRIPALIAAAVSSDLDQYRKRHNFSWRFFLFQQIPFIFVDIVCLPFFLVGWIIAPWRIPKTVRFWTRRARSDAGDTGPAYFLLWCMSFQSRGMIFLHFFKALLDYPAMALVVLFTVLTPWRWAGFAEGFSQVKNDLRGRRTVRHLPKTMSVNKVAWLLFYEIIVLGAFDFLVVIITLFPLLTLYRAYSVIQGLRVNDTGLKRRRAMALQFAFWLLDIATIPFFVMVLVTVIRMPSLITKIRRGKSFGITVSHFGRYSDPTGHIEVMWQWCLMWRDLPFLLMFISMCLIFIWRGIICIYRLYKLPAPRRKRDIRVTVAKQMLRVLIDIVDIPWVVTSIIIFVTVWRAVPYAKELRAAEKRNERRLVAMKHALFWLWDIPTAIAFLLLMLTVYRAKDTILGIGQVWQAYWRRASAAVRAQGGQPAAVPAPDDDNPAPGGDSDNPAPAGHGPINAAGQVQAQVPYSWHTVVWFYFSRLLLDLPFPVLALMTLWRLPWLLKRVFTEHENAQDRRIDVLRTLLKVGIDIPVALFFLLCCLSWRIVSVVDLFKTYKRGDNEHKAVMKIFGQYLIDWPFVIMALVTIVIPWRGIPMLITLIFIGGPREVEWTKDPDFEKNYTTVAGRRRLMAFAYFFFGILDFIAAALTLATLPFFWRIHVTVQHIRNIIKEDVITKFRHTIGWYIAILATWRSMIYDLVGFVYIAFIFAGVIHVPTLLYRIFLMTKRHFTNAADMTEYEAYTIANQPVISGPMTGPRPADPNVERVFDKYPAPKKVDLGAPDKPVEKSKDDEKADPDAPPAQPALPKTPPSKPHFQYDWEASKKQRYFEMEQLNDGYSWSWTIYRPIIAEEMHNTIRHVPHLFVLPLKLLGLIFVPIHLLVAWRTKAKGSEEDRENAFISWLALPLYWLVEVCQPRLNFWGLHEFAILNLAGIFFVVTNELAMLVLIVNSLFMFIVTLLSPLWRKAREDSGWLGLGTAIGCCNRTVETIILIEMVYMTPVFLALQVILYLAPIAAVGAALSTPTLGSVLQFTDFLDFWRQFWSTPEFWRALPFWTWILQAYWTLVMTACWHLTILHAKRTYELFNPLVAYLWLVKRVMMGMFWRGYKLLLGGPTQFAYRHRRTCCCLGELLMIPVVVIWTFWSIVIPLATQIYWLFFLSGPIILLLGWFGLVAPSSVIRANWRTIKKVVKSPNPLLNLTNIRFSLPPAGGLAIELEGLTPRNYRFEGPPKKQAQLILAGDPFWQCLPRFLPSQAVVAFKSFFHPITLFPTYTSPTEFKQTSGLAFKWKVTVPSEMKVLGKEFKVKTKTVQEALGKIVDNGDPDVEFQIEHGELEFGYKKQGFLVRFQTKFSEIQTSIAKKSPLVCKIPNSTYDPLNPPAAPMPLTWIDANFAEGPSAAAGAGGKEEDLDAWSPQSPRPPGANDGYTAPRGGLREVGTTTSTQAGGKRSLKDSLDTTPPRSPMDEFWAVCRGMKLSNTDLCSVFRTLSEVDPGLKSDPILALAYVTRSTGNLLATMSWAKIVPLMEAEAYKLVTEFADVAVTPDPSSSVWVLSLLRITTSQAVVWAKLSEFAGHSESDLLILALGDVDRWRYDHAVNSYLDNKTSPAITKKVSEYEGKLAQALTDELEKAPPARKKKVEVAESESDEEKKGQDLKSSKSSKSPKDDATDLPKRRAKKAGSEDEDEDEELPLLRASKKGKGDLAKSQPASKVKSSDLSPLNPFKEDIADAEKAAKGKQDSLTKSQPASKVKSSKKDGGAEEKKADDDEASEPKRSKSPDLKKSRKAPTEEDTENEDAAPVKKSKSSELKKSKSPDLTNSRKAPATEEPKDEEHASSPPSKLKRSRKGEQPIVNTTTANDEGPDPAVEPKADEATPKGGKLKKSRKGEESIVNTTDESPASEPKAEEAATVPAEETTSPKTELKKSRKDNDAKVDTKELTATTEEKADEPTAPASGNLKKSRKGDETKAAVQSAEDRPSEELKAETPISPEPKLKQSRKGKEEKVEAAKEEPPAEAKAKAEASEGQVTTGNEDKLE